MNTPSQTFWDDIRTMQHFAKAQDQNFRNYVNKKNNVIVSICAIFSILIQASNLFRVLFFTTSKLHSFNNRIFFGFYLCLFLASALILLLQHANIHRTTNGIYFFHLSCTCFYVFWNLLLNSYSIYRNPTSSNIVYISSLIFCAILMRFKPKHAISLYLGSYLVFLILNHSVLNMDDVSNLNIILFVAIFSIITLFFQEIKYVYNQQELLRINEVLTLEEDRLRLGLEKHQFIMEETNIFSFDWNLLEDTFIPSRKCCETLDWPSTISQPIQWFSNRDTVFETDQPVFFELLNNCIKNKEHGSVEVRIRDYSANYTWYRLQLFIQCDHTGHATSAIGVLLNIDGTTRLIANLNNQLHTQMEGAKQYLDHIKDTQEQTKIYRHDMRHSLLLMEQLANQGNMEKLLSFLKETHSKLESITPNYYCENETVNLILGSMDQLARKQQISFATDVIIPQGLPILDTELSSLLFNLIDNAMTAASHVTDASLRFVRIKAIYNKNNKNNLLVFVKNGFNGDVLMEDDIPIPTSSEEGHGFGIKSITSIVEHYNGLYTFEPQEQIFSAKILLMLENHD